MIEIPPKLKDMEPIHPGAKERNHYRNAEGLAEDIRFFGRMVSEAAFKKIGHNYPKVESGGKRWRRRCDGTCMDMGRTIASPNPAVGGVTSRLVSTLAGKKPKKKVLD